MSSYQSKTGTGRPRRAGVDLTIQKINKRFGEKYTEQLELTFDLIIFIFSP